MLPALKHTIIFLLAFFFAENTLCQQTKFRVTNYDETTGLQSSVINAMLQDSRGYIWFGTADGLCRYDGYNFKTFRKVSGENNSLPGNYVIKLAEDHNGKIWIGLQKDGISSYDPATGIFRNYDVKNVDSSASPLARAVTILFVDKENNLWAGIQQKGIIKLNKETGKFSHYNIIADTNTFFSKEVRSIYNTVYDMYEEGNGIYWLATHDGLYRFNANTASMLPVRAKPLQKTGLRDDLFHTIARDKNGLWLSSWAGGLSFYNFNTNQWYNYKFSSRYKNVATTNIILDLEPKNENELWIASIDKGLGIFNKTTHRFFFFADDSSTHSLIAGKSCSAVMQDKQNNVWVLHEEGLSKIQQTQQKFVFVPVKLTSYKNTAGYNVTAMLEDKEGKYLFTGTALGDGLHITNKLTGKTQIVSFDLLPDEESIMAVSDIMQDSKGIIWILTRDYVYQYDESKNKLVSLPQPPPYMNGTRSNLFTVIKEDKKGKIWIATQRNGIFCYDPETKTYKHFYSDGSKKNSLPSNVTPALSIDGRGRIWIGGFRGCFGYLDNAENFISLDEYGKPSGKNFDVKIYSLYADRNGDIWSGTDAGLFYYDTHENIPQLKKVYNADNGLRGDISPYIQEDREGSIWCATSSALCKINNQTGSITTFGKPDGINANIVGGIFLFSDGRMSLFTYGGYYIYNPSSLQEKNTTVPLVITSFKIDDKEQFFENKIAAKQKMIVPASANVISFEFAALDFTRPDKQQYAYKLESFDKDWVVAGQRRYAGYANIPGGDYIFKVKATNTPDNWNVPEIAIPIHVEQPFYKTWWFIATVIAVAAVSFYIFFKGKLRKQQQICQLETKAQTLEKEKAVVMYESLKQQLNPHFLFNSLTSLSSLIRYDQKKAGDFLDGLSKIYRYILKSRDHETVPLTEEIKFVQTFIKLQQTRFDHGFVVNINIDKEYDHCKIPPVTLQNLIENAIKHNIIDDESPLVIDIYTEGNYIVTRNNLQKKNFVETSNRQGLASLTSLYHYLSSKPVLITETEQYFFVKIPMI